MASPRHYRKIDEEKLDAISETAEQIDAVNEEENKTEVENHTEQQETERPPLEITIEGDTASVSMHGSFFTIYNAIIARSEILEKKHKELDDNEVDTAEWIEEHQKVINELIVLNEVINNLFAKLGIQLIEVKSPADLFGADNTEDKADEVEVQEEPDNNVQTASSGFFGNLFNLAQSFHNSLRDAFHANDNGYGHDKDDDNEEENENISSFRR